MGWNSGPILVAGSQTIPVSSYSWKGMTFDNADSNIVVYSRYSPIQAI